MVVALGVQLVLERLERHCSVIKLVLVLMLVLVLVLMLMLMLVLVLVGFGGYEKLGDL